MNGRVDSGGIEAILAPTPTRRNGIYSTNRIICIACNEKGPVSRAFEIDTACDQAEAGVFSSWRSE